MRDVSCSSRVGKHRRFGIMHYGTVAVLAGAAVTACSDVPTAAPPVESVNRAVVETRGTLRDTSFAPALRAAARVIARGLGAPGSRAAVRDAMRASLLGDHKLKLEELPGSPAGRELIAAAAAATGRSAESIAAELGALPPTDMYVALRADRRSWSAGPRVRVVALVDRSDPVQRGYGTGGDSLDIDGSASRRGDVVIVVAPAGDRTRRIGPQRARAGSVIQDEDDGEVTGSATYFNATGDSVVVELADILTLADVTPQARRRGGDTGPSSSRGSASGRPSLSLMSAAAAGPADTTRLVGFMISYRDGGGWFGSDDFSEPYFRSYRGIVRSEVRFTHIRTSQYYYPNIPLIHSRVQPWISNAVQVELKEDDSWDVDPVCESGSGENWRTNIYERHRGRWTTLHCPYTDTKEGEILLDWTPSTYTPPVISAHFDYSFHSNTDRTSRTGCQRTPSIRALADGGLEFTSEYVMRNAVVGSSNPNVAQMQLYQPPSVPNPEGASNQPVGTLQYIGPGDVTMTAWIGSVRAQSTFTVVPYVAYIDLTPNAATLAPGEKATFTVRRYDASGRELIGCRALDNYYGNYMDYDRFPPPKWITTSPEVASLVPVIDYSDYPPPSRATVTANSPGTTTIAVRWGHFRDETQLTVPTAGTLASLVITPDYVVLYPGSSRQASVRGYDAFGGYAPVGPVTWATREEWIAGVDANGWVSVPANAIPGSVTVLTATSGDIVGTAYIEIGDPCEVDPYAMGCEPEPCSGFDRDCREEMLKIVRARPTPKVNPGSIAGAAERVIAPLRPPQRRTPR